MSGEGRGRVVRWDAKEKREVGESLDFVEEGLYDVFWALVVVVS